MEQSLSIYEFDDYRSFLRNNFNYKKAHNSNISLRSIASFLGFRSPPYLAMILNGDRKFPSKHLPKLINYLELSEKEGQYLENLIALNHAKSMDEINYIKTKIVKLNPSAKDYFTLDVDTFTLMSNPIHFLILEMTNLKEFQNDPRWISKKTGGIYRPNEVKIALTRLQRLGLLEERDGRLVKSRKKLATTHNISSEAVRNFHKLSIALANHALNTQPIEERSITSSVLAIDDKDIPKIKTQIDEFRRSLCQQYEAPPGTGNKVYQINLQFFNLTNETALKGTQNDQTQTTH